MKFKKYLDSLVGMTGELSADDVTYVFTVRPGEEAKTPATLVRVDEDFAVFEVKFRRRKINRVIPLGLVSLCISEE